MILKGNCLDTLKTLPDCSVDSIVTDPPYELGFMGKSWDNSGIAYNQDLWAECLRVLKPGGHLLAFSGSRTYHRMVVAIEDAGFEIRDQIMWLYGSGFPKSHNIGKAIDKRGGVSAGFEQFRDAVKEAMNKNGVSRSQLQEALGNFMLSHYLTAGSQPAVPNYTDYKIIRDTVNLGGKFDHLFQVEAEREVVGFQKRGNSVNTDFMSGGNNITTASTPEAQQWQGWGTALKPAHEPIVVARKSLIGTVANNVLTYGTGALNIDGSRVGTGGQLLWEQPRGMGYHGGSDSGVVVARPSEQGRWPANVIHDGSDEVVAGFPNEAARFFKSVPIDEADTQSFIYCAKASKSERNAGLEGLPERRESDRERDDGVGGDNPRNRTNEAKQNFHPTVKPLALMRYLIKLVTPPGGTVLDPFLGSGTTAVAAILEGFEWIGCEMTEDYFPIIEARVEWAENQPKTLI